MKQITMFMGLCALFFQTGCNSKGEEKKEEETEFLVTSPIVRDTMVTKDYVCQIHAIQHIELRAQERGYLQKIYVDEGQPSSRDSSCSRSCPCCTRPNCKRPRPKPILPKSNTEHQGTGR